MKDIHEKLKALEAMQTTTHAFDDPFAEPDTINIEMKMPQLETNPKKKSKSPKVFEKIDSIARDSEEIFDFDSYIESVYLYGEDDELKDQLIRMGRKYAKDNRITEEDNEVLRAFNPQERKIESLIREVETDKQELQKDISYIRGMRNNRSSKTLVELVQAKAQFHTIQLNAIKEISGIKKTQFDLRLKAKKDDSHGDSNELAATNAIQKLLSMGHGTLLASVGGRESVSGALREEDDADDDQNDIDLLSYASMDSAPEIVQNKYLDGLNNDSDGDKFIKYENDKVNYILTIDENNHRTVHAEDKDGNVVPDFPLPSNINDIEIMIDTKNNSAIDLLQREYIVRRTYPPEEEQDE